ncbi:helix-turn-helix domain-containing protein, partial [Streptosporangium amethystogenes]|uniref:helix-turn-helix domain-containing protein n=1 Tax=Streptosporangium amethystogenes TaxID=2002 RepID=UPI0004C6F9C3
MGKKGEGFGGPRVELARARRQRGLSQKAAAERVGVASTTWSRWEQGVQGVRAGSRWRLAELFEVSPVEVERWIDGWSFGETSSWPITEYGDTSTAATVRSAALLWRYEMDETRRHLLASLPFVPAALGEWLTAWNYGVPPQTVAQRGT